MLRSFVAAAAATALTVTLTGVTTSALADDGGKTAAPTAGAARARADAALTTARKSLAGDARVSATMALRDLRLAYPDLSAAGRKQADGILARPTDPGDPDQYTVAEAPPVCGAHVCIHYVTSTADAPDTTDGPDAGTTPDWVDANLAEMEAVWNYETGTLGYRTPATDGSLGGNAQFDVYLGDVGADGLYGYCAPENYVPGQQWRASGYCVLDNDFAVGQFGAPPVNSLKVTAAHEFFHAVQFNYDFAEDHWLMEATSTWMEERYADAVNDNRQYLTSSQIRRPYVPLDKFEPSGFGQYGNWVFFERLTGQYGVAAVRAIWSRLDATAGRPDQFSTQGVKTYLASRHTTLPKFYAKFGAGNIVPRKFYPEGAAYPKAPIAKTFSLSKSRRSTGRWNTKLNHLTNINAGFKPARTLKGTWRLRLTVDGPPANTGPAAYVLVFLKSGRVVQKPVSLNAQGNGSATVKFSRSTVSRVTLTLANASSRFTCWKGTNYSCQGTPKDNAQKFVFSGTAVR